jgi:hypothetical protein
LTADHWRTFIAEVESAIFSMHPHSSLHAATTQSVGMPYPLA